MSNEVNHQLLSWILSPATFPLTSLVCLAVHIQYSLCALTVEEPVSLRYLPAYFANCLNKSMKNRKETEKLPQK